MKPFKTLLLFSSLFLVSTVLFQNCGGEEGPKANDSNNSNSLPPPPEFLVNRDLAFDNKIVANQLLETIWSVGSSDIFYYETDYKAVYESTLVTVTGENQSPVMTVKTDSCENSKVLSTAESQELSGFYSSYINATEIRTRGVDAPPVTPGCAFPRLALNATGLLPASTSDPGGDPVDFDIYFSTAECTPDNEFYITNRNGNDPAAALDDVRSFFRAQIDELCE